MKSSKGKILIIIASLAIGVFVAIEIFTNFSTNKKVVTKISQASNSSASLSSQVDWEAGTVSGLDTTSTPGSIKIDFTGSEIFTGGTVTTTGSGDPALAHDGNTATGISLTDRNQELLWDLGTNKTVTKVRFYSTNYDISSLQLYHSGSWNIVGATGEGGNWYKFESPVAGVSKVRILGLDTGIPWPGWTLPINEFEIYTTNGSATHTTAAIQISGGDNFWAWQTFTPTESVVANTTLTYKFRSSADSSTWTDWSAAQTIASLEAKDISSLVTSRSGDTKYKYLQVQATLTSTDGTSTPTISDYSIGYHTNVAPNAPTGLTAVIGN